MLSRPPAPVAGVDLTPSISHVCAPGGRRVPVLKVLQNSACRNNCRYCAFRAGRDVRRAHLTPDELARGVDLMYRAGIIEGIFLSSGIGDTLQDHGRDAGDGRAVAWPVCLSRLPAPPAVARLRGRASGTRRGARRPGFGQPGSAGRRAAGLPGPGQTHGRAGRPLRAAAAAIRRPAGCRKRFRLQRRGPAAPGPKSSRTMAHGLRQTRRRALYRPRPAGPEHPVRGGPRRRE